MTNPDVLAKQLLHRAHNRDGLAEILLGILFVLVAGIQYIWITIPHRSPVFLASVLLYAFGFPAACFLTPRWLRSIRRRYLIERAGYVEPLPRRTPFPRYAMIGAVAVVIILAQVATQPRLPDYWLTGFTGVAGGILAAICGRAPRFYFAGFVMAATGLSVAIAQLPMLTGFMIIFGIQGVVELISGGIVWMRFLAETREAVTHER